MNTLDPKGVERFFARSLKDLPGGVEAACGWPDSPVNAKRMSDVGRGLRRLNLGDAVLIAEMNGLANFFRVIADQIDGGSNGETSVLLEEVATDDALDSADLLRTVREANRDQHHTVAEIEAIRKAATTNLNNAVKAMDLALKLQSGPITVPRRIDEAG